MVLVPSHSRVLWPLCQRATRPARPLLEASGIVPERAGEFLFREGAGCGDCRGTGFKGRKAIAEVLNLNEEIRELIVARSPFRELRVAAARNGTLFLRGQALALVRNGETTLEEINRVTVVA